MARTSNLGHPVQALYADEYGFEASGNFLAFRVFELVVHVGPMELNGDGDKGTTRCCSSMVSRTDRG